ncbi:MAG: UDP-N-acetylmuramoyl-L-alanyl-D-glutamate--2,6-diaminopimelate ligase [Pseudomonadota bacterium]
MMTHSLKTILHDFIELDFDVQLSGLCLDSRQVKPRDLFFAYPGTQTDGRKFIDDAMMRGAAAVVCDGETIAVRVQNDVPIITLPMLSQKVSAIASCFYDHPSHDLTVIAVTGTNGKTSCCYLLAQALKKLNRKAVFIGTLGHGDTDDLKSHTGTTPDAITLQRLLFEYRAQGVDVVAMEASSHALDQGRLAGVKVAIGVLTNVTRDHLDYHHDMQSYADAKYRLFEMSGIHAAVLNLDDETGREWKNRLKKVKTVGYGLHHPAAISAQNIQLSMEGIVAEVCGSFGSGQLTSHLLGDINISNLLAVLSVLMILNYSMQNSLAAISVLSTVPGRLQVVSQCHPIVVIDYAHTPDALEKTLATLRQLCQHDLHCVFGCGGDRDVGKRPMMARVAEQFADYIVLTDDNVRKEDPEKIFSDIKKGFLLLDKVHVEHDRKKAIQYALHHAQKGDVVLIAGKGHENYQIIGDHVIAFSDHQVVKELLEE